MSNNIIKQFFGNIDPHITVDYFKDNKQLDSEFFQVIKAQALSKTKLLDTFSENLKDNNLPVSEDLQQKIKQEKVLMQKKYKSCIKKSGKLVKIVSANYTDLQTKKFDKDAIQDLLDRPVNQEQIRFFIRLARINFDIGQYQTSLRQLQCIQPFCNNQQLQTICMGKLVISIILGLKEDQEGYFEELSKALNGSSDENSQLIGKRVYMINTVLYLNLFKDGITYKDFQKTVKIFSQEQNLHAIQIACPYMLRYLVASQLLSNQPFDQSNDFDLNQAADIISDDHNQYSDSLTRFLESLLVEFDFEEAHKQYNLIRQDFENDFFLKDHVDQLLKNAKNVYFDTYCRIYNAVDLKEQSKKFGMEVDEAEVFIVNLLRKQKIHAKVYNDNNLIQIQYNQPKVHDNIQSEVKKLVPRTQLLLANMKQIISQKKQQK